VRASGHVGGVPELVVRSRISVTSSNALTQAKGQEIEGPWRERTRTVIVARYWLTVGRSRMADILTRIERSRRMGRVRQKGTSPEIAVGTIVRGLGLTYSRNSSSLPGRPDLVFRKNRKAIFVHGCFWHGHSCRRGRPPASRTEYWIPKLKENRSRDRRKKKLLEDAGWKVLVVWQCELKNRAKLTRRLARFLAVPPVVGPRTEGC